MFSAFLCLCLFRALRAASLSAQMLRLISWTQPLYCLLYAVLILNNSRIILEFSESWWFYFIFTSGYCLQDLSNHFGVSTEAFIPILEKLLQIQFTKKFLLAFTDEVATVNFINIKKNIYIYCVNGFRNVWI